MRLYITSMSSINPNTNTIFLIYSLVLIFKKLPPPKDIIEYLFFDKILIMMSFLTPQK